MSPTTKIYIAKFQNGKPCYVISDSLENAAKLAIKSIEDQGDLRCIEIDSINDLLVIVDPHIPRAPYGETGETVCKNMTITPEQTEEASERIDSIKPITFRIGDKIRIGKNENFCPQGLATIQKLESDDMLCVYLDSDKTLHKYYVEAKFVELI